MPNLTIASISGTMLAPGVSRNNRLYTKDLIGKTVKRMQERINDPDGLPIVMRTHHEAGDDSSLIVGRITSADTDEGGNAVYTASLYDTQPGRDIASLVTADEPALRSTSIHGYWLGPVKQVEHGGKRVETADDLEVDAIDFTASPGVLKALVNHGSSRRSESATVERTAVNETYAAQVEVVTEAASDHVVPGCDGKCCDECGVNAGSSSETAWHAFENGQCRSCDVAEKGAPVLKSGKPAKPPTPGASNYADPGYQDDGAKRYPLDTKAHVKAAWSYINMPKNAKMYTDKQIARIKSKIKSAASKFGIKINDDGTHEAWLIESGAVAEMYDAMATVPGSFCVRLCNGPIDVVISSYCVDPADLDVVGRAAMNGACQALAALDPDWDADIDVTAPSQPERAVTPDDDLETATESAQRDKAPTPRDVFTSIMTSSTSGGGSINTSDTIETGKEPTVSEATNEATTTAAAPARSLTDEDVKVLSENIGAAFAAALSKHATLETAPVKAQAVPDAPAATKPAQTVATESTTKVDESTALKEAFTELQTDLVKTVASAVTSETDKIRDELRSELMRVGIAPSRRGFRVHENDQAAELTPEQLYDDRANILLGDFAKTPVPHPGTGTAPTLQTPAATTTTQS